MCNCVMHLCDQCDWMSQKVIIRAAKKKPKAENFSFLAHMSNFWAAEMVYFGLNTYFIGELLLKVNN